MTNSRVKKAVRSRMAETGEKYTQALRALRAEWAEQDAAREKQEEAGDQDSDTADSS